ncbi:MAG: hypothetical protein OQL19_00505 [Gammaproteobacteria bacterium]|nr:hypothetical protein [Gammaproteobacteria bacterium]
MWQVIQFDVLFKIVIVLILSLSMNACITTQAPKISHVHIGHAMTAWRSTPDEQGLFVVAEKEAAIASEHAQYAVENSHDLSLVKMHTMHVLHTMKPELVPDMSKNGPGLGYGFVKAMNDSNDHILFAADSADASTNIKTSALLWSEHTQVVIERSELLITLGQALLKSNSHEEIIVLADEILLLTQQNINGYDSDGDGTIGNVKDDYGLIQLRKDINRMINNENPPYQTVEKKYLFGLIQLSSGEWTFSQDKNTSQGSGAFQY